MEIGQLLSEYYINDKVSKSKGIIDWENEEVHKLASPSIVQFSNGVMVHIREGVTISMTYTLDSVRVNLHEHQRTYFIYNSVGFEFEQIINDIISRFRIDGRDDISSFLLEHNLLIIEEMKADKLKHAS